MSVPVVSGSTMLVKDAGADKAKRHAEEGAEHSACLHAHVPCCGLD